MIFIDSNIPMYLVGARHPNKVAAQHLLERVVAAEERLVTSAEVLQEILHRYVAIQRRDAIESAFHAILGVVDEVFAVESRDVEEAKRLVATLTQLSARDALHVAIMRRRRVSRIMSFDAGFDAVDGIQRMS